MIWGDLAYTADGCSGTYAVKGVWPAVICPSMNPIECFCTNVADGVKITDEACAPTGLNQDFASQIQCVEGSCVFADTLRPR